MKKTILLLVILLALISSIISFKYKLNKDLSQPVFAPTPLPSPSPSPIIKKSKKTHSLFVPYWTLDDMQAKTDGYDEIIYFGIEPDLQGIKRTKQEINRLEQFSKLMPSHQRKLVALRMIDTKENFDILKNPALQEKIIDQSLEIANQYDMKGIVLDLEISAIPFDSLTRQINAFAERFYSSAKNSGLTFSLALYGDTFYRARPYDIKTLNQNADSIMIMAYDLHKSKGNPGPGFPLNGREKFGYDLSVMIDEFLKTVPPHKITVIFGAFGYDWQVTQKEQTVGTARAFTLAQIKQKFIDNCRFAACRVSRDKDAWETQVRYIDTDNKDHIIWFEDMESIKRKQEFLEQKGISSFSYWAYTYF